MRANTSDSSSSSDEERLGASALLLHLAQDLEKSTLELVWRQWKALGASTALSKDASRQLQSLIDPEALLLFSLLIRSEERRLDDIVRDWIVVNSDLISVQRVKNLAKDYPDDLQPSLSQHLHWLGDIAFNEGRDFRWKSLMSHTMPNELSHTDARVSKRRAVRARLLESVTLVLRLRLGFGVGVKADLISYLLAIAERKATVREIADATGYTSVGVRRAAEDLAAARLVLSSDVQPSTYWVDRSAWTDLLKLEPGAAVWQSWHSKFVFVLAFISWARMASEHPLTPYAFGVHGRQLMEQHRDAFEHGWSTQWSMYSNVPDWAHFVQQTVQSLSSSMIEWA